MSRRTTRRNTTRRPQWMATIAILVSLANMLMRLFRMFGGKKRSTISSRTRSRATTSRESATPRTQKKSTKKASPKKSAATSRTKGNQSRTVEEDRVSDGGIMKLFLEKKSDVLVTASGPIVKILPDDTDTSDGSSMHQKWLVELLGPGGDMVTVKIAHNLDFGRVPVEEGDEIGFRGEYEWTEYGGTVHWTHHDPRGIHAGGWIDHNGKRYE